MKWLAIFFVVIIIAVGGILLIPEPENPDHPNGGKTPDGQTSTGKDVFTYVNSAAHRTLDPQKASWMMDLRVINCLYEKLVDYTVPDMTIDPGVAKSWDASEDNKTFTFHLRKDAKWSNGDPVTAQDFVYGWRRAMLPDHGAEYATLFFHIKGAQDFYNWRQQQTNEYAKKATSLGADQKVQQADEMWKLTQQKMDEMVGLKATDDHTLVVETVNPTPYFVELCAFELFVPVHRPTLEKTLSKPNPDTGLVQQDPTWTRAETAITNGPYVMSEWKPRHFILMKPNAHYWNKDAVKNGGIREKFIEDESTAKLAYEQGQVDWLPGFPTSVPAASRMIEAARAGERDDVFTSSAAGTYFYKFNCRETLPGGRKNPLHDARVRRALSMAIDRKAIVENVTRVHQPIAKTFIPPGSIGNYTPPADAGVEFNEDEARKLLAEAGYPNGEGLEGLELLYNTGGGHERTAQEVVSGWKKHLNLNVSLKGKEVKVMQDDMDKGTFTIVRAGWYGDYRDPTTFLQYFVTGDGHNDGKYHNAEYDRLFAAAATETDAAKRLELLRRAEEIMISEQPLAPIYHYMNLELWRPDQISGLKVNPWNVWRLHQVSVKR